MTDNRYGTLLNGSSGNFTWFWMSSSYIYVCFIRQSIPSFVATVFKVGSFGAKQSQKCKHHNFDCTQLFLANLFNGIRLKIFSISFNLFCSNSVVYCIYSYVRLWNLNSLTFLLLTRVDQIASRFAHLLYIFMI